VCLGSRYLHHVNQCDKLGVEELIKWLGKAVCRHLSARAVAHSDVAVLTLLLSVFVVDVNVLCALMESVLADHVECWFIICLEMKRSEIMASIAEL
jgi:hypothetical protein